MKPQIFKLKNELSVLSVPITGSQTVTVLVLVRAGSRYETKNTNGLSHLLEHMCFKGTTKRASAFAISNELESIGAISNAFTGHEVTGYFAKGLPEHVEQITDVVSDIYQNSLFPESELAKEKGVIIEEMNMYEDLPQALVEYDLYKLIFGESPLGMRIIGSKESVTNLTRDDIVTYHADRYIPNETLLVIAGNISDESVHALGAKYFGDLVAVSDGADQIIKTTQTEPRINVRKKTSDQTHLSLAFRAFSTYDPRMPILETISGVLGQGMAARLFQILREEMGACYYVHSNVHSYREEGFIEISAGVDTKRINEVVARIYAECQKLKTELVSDSELSRVKEYDVGTLKLSLESSNAHAMLFGEQGILGKPIQTPDELAAEIRGVTSTDIQTLAQEIFKSSNANLAVVGPDADVTTLGSIFI